MNEPVWLITGSSTGFGRALAEAILDRGWRAVVTARDPSSVADLADLHPGQARALVLDVTDRARCDAVMAETVEAFGQVDVVVNNAGYGMRGALEEQSEQQLRDLVETNVFGVLNMTRAALPTLRARRNGHLIQMSSVAGAAPALGGGSYAGTKFAVEGFSEGLAAEVAHLGIRVTIVQPGPFRTEFAGRSMAWAQPIADYDEVLAPVRDRTRELHGNQPGDPGRAAEAIIAVTELDDPPLRLPLGENAFTRIRQQLRNRLDELDRTEPLGMDTAFA